MAPILRTQNSFYFVAQICILRVATGTKAGGSTLEVWLKATDQDPNSFGIATTDFSVADSQGNDSAQDGLPGCLSDDNNSNPEYTLSPGQAMVLPVPVCFPLNFGGQPKSLTWEDITLPLQ